MALKMFRAVILGAPASGKGTISSRIVKSFNLEHISSGDKLRQHIKDQTPMGKEVSTFLKSGKLVSDDIMVKFILNEIKAVGDRPWLLDGFPRTKVQCASLWEKQKLDLAINLVVPFDVIIDRIKGRWVHLPSGRVYNTDFNAPKVPGKDDETGEPLVQREDDKPDVVQKRLNDYDKMTKPVIEFYREKGILVDFEGRTSNEIWPKVLDNLTSRIPVNIAARE